MSASRLFLPTAALGRALATTFTTIVAAALVATLATTVCARAQDGAFAAADKNGDGALDKAEFRTFIDQLAKAGRPNAVKIKSSGRYDFAFGRVDKNGDGRITPDELSSMQ